MSVVILGTQGPTPGKLVLLNFADDAMCVVRLV